MGSVTVDGRYFEPAILCANWAAICEIVSRSDVVSARAHALLDTPGTPADFAILPVAAPWFVTDMAITWRRDRVPHPALRTFRDAVRRSESRVMDKKKAMQAVA